MAPEVNVAALYADAMRLMQQRQLGAAERRLRECLAIQPQSTMLLGNLAALFVMQRRYGDARQTLEEVLSLDPAIAEAWLNLGIIEEEQECDFDAALKSFDQALKLRASYPEAHFNRANVLARMNRLDDAIASYRAALAVAPRYVDALHNLANTWRSAADPQRALEAFNAAIKLTPRADLYLNRGYTLRDIGEYQAAIKSFDKALQLDPAAPSCRGIRLHTKAQIGDWSNWQGQVEEMKDSIERGEIASPPLCVLHLIDSGDLQKCCAERWAEANHPAQYLPDVVAPRENHGRLRIGYFSADFKDHPVAKFLINLIGQHDRSRFESIGFSFGRASEDPMRRQLMAAFDQFHEVSLASDRDIATLARELEIDIAVDLSGHTANARPGIFAMRAAPIQINYLGYPGTMGAPYMDYLMADRVVIPRGDAGWYSEKIVALPNLYTNAYKGDDVSGSATRRDYLLPDASVVYCCLNNTWKIDPAMFSSWMSILKNTGDSVLFLLGSEPLAITHLQREARKSGVDPRRLVFSGRVAKSEYLARFRVADLYLDTFPYNAATTALDALFMGLPLVTLCGDTYAARQAASVLTSLDLKELVTTTRAEYEALAISLGREPQRLEQFKLRLKTAVAGGAGGSAVVSPAFDAVRYARHVEAAYSAIQTRHLDGHAPDHIDIPAQPPPP